MLWSHCVLLDCDGCVLVCVVVVAYVSVGAHVVVIRPASSTRHHRTKDLEAGERVTRSPSERVNVPVITALALARQHIERIVCGVQVRDASGPIAAAIKTTTEQRVKIDHILDTTNMCTISCSPKFSDSSM